MKFAAIILLAFLASTQASSGWGLGWCARPTLQSDFTISDYLGTWYERARVKNIRFEKGDCVSAQYSLNADNTVKVINSQYVNGQYESMQGQAYCESQKSGQCYVRFSDNQPWGDYEVVKTDYENFSIVYSCTNLYVAHYKIAWVLARDPEFDPSQAVAALSGLGFDASDFYFTKQGNCS